MGMVKANVEVVLPTLFPQGIPTNLVWSYDYEQYLGKVEDDESFNSTFIMFVPEPIYFILISHMTRTGTAKDEINFRAITIDQYIL